MTEELTQETKVCFFVKTASHVGLQILAARGSFPTGRIGPNYFFGSLKTQSEKYTRSHLLHLAHA